MAELTHDEDGFHEIQLSGKQIVFLFMATTVVLVSIFLCGVMVGRGVRAQQLEETDSPVATTSAPEPAAPVEGLTQSQTPPDNAGDSDAALRSAEPPPPPPLKREPEQPPVQVTPPPPPAAPPVAEVDVPTSGRPGAWVIQVTALQNRGSATQIVKQLLDKGHPAFLQNPAPGAPVIYRVRLGGFKDRRDAENLAIQLRKELQFDPVVTRR